MKIAIKIRSGRPLREICKEASEEAYVGYDPDHGVRARWCDATHTWTTAWSGFKYAIGESDLVDAVDDEYETLVSYEGAMHGLLRQNLLPVVMQERESLLEVKVLESSEMTEDSITTINKSLEGQGPWAFKYHNPCEYLHLAREMVRAGLRGFNVVKIFRDLDQTKAEAKNRYGAAMEYSIAVTGDGVAPQWCADGHRFGAEGDDSAKELALKYHAFFIGLIVGVE